MVKKFLKCEICGNLFGVLDDAGVTPECCAQPMVELVANTTDAAQEKHVPVIERDGCNVCVKVGSVPHPMGDDHYIDWIIVTTGVLTERKELKVGDAPEAEFCIDEDLPITALAYCNLHGLWKAQG